MALSASRFGSVTIFLGFLRLLGRTRGLSVLEAVSEENIDASSVLLDGSVIVVADFDDDAIATEDVASDVVEVKDAI